MHARTCEALLIFGLLVGLSPSSAYSQQMAIRLYQLSQSTWMPSDYGLLLRSMLENRNPQLFASTAAAGSLTPQALAPPINSDPTFSFRDSYAFPNPSVHGQTITIRLQAGLADSVVVHIYDMSGRIVHSGNAGSPTIVDDGHGKGPQYTYDYPWDVSGTPSGIYVYTIKAKRSGQSDIRRKGKVAVVK